MKKRKTIWSNPQGLLSATLAFQITGVLEVLIARELYDDKLYSLLCVNIAEMVNPTDTAPVTKIPNRYLTVNFTA